MGNSNGREKSKNATLNNSRTNTKGKKVSAHVVKAYKFTKVEGDQ